MRIKQAVSRLPGHVLLWMDGSLFFRAIAAVMDFIKRLCADSCLVKLVTADYNEDRLKDSMLVRLAEGILNAFPKIPRKPDYWPAALSNLLSGSIFIRGTAEALDTPIPPPAGKTNKGVLSVLAWLAAAIPVWGMLAVTAGAPFLPTMVLAGILAVVLPFTLFSRQFTLDITGAALLVFIIVTFFCAVTSLTPGASIRIALLTSMIMISYLLIHACYSKRAQIEFFFFAFITSAAAAGLVGLYQFLMGKEDTTWTDRELFSELGLRVYATFGNPNVYGAYLLLAVPVAAVLVLYTKNIWLKIYAAGVSGLLLVNLLLSYSRGCYLALALAALVFMLLVEKRLVVFFSAGIFALPYVLPQSIIDRLLSITNLSDSSTSFRLSIWQGTLRMLKGFWMTGVGQGIDAYNRVYPFYSFNAIDAPHSHNLFLQIFVETGIVGLLVFAAVLGCFFRTMASFLRRADKRDKFIAAAIIAAVIGFLFQGIFDYVFYNYKVMLTFFIFMGLGTAFAKAAGAPEAPCTGPGQTSNAPSNRAGLS